MSKSVFARIIISLLVVVGTIAGPASVFAARPDSLKDTITDSRPSTNAQHTIVLNQATGTQFIATETVTITFPAGFTVPAFLAADVTFADASGSVTVQDAACGATDTVRVTVSGQAVTFTACGSYVAGASGGDLTMVLGTTSTKATNHATPGSYTIVVAGSYGDDSQDTVIVITSAITISATIDETLTNTVAAVVAGSCTTTGGTTITSTATTIPYATVTPETFYDICQSLTVATNAAGGYTVTVYTVAGLDSGANAFAVGSCDGACTLTDPAAWATATFNGYAICMDDTTGNGAETANGDWVAAGQCGGGSQQFELVADLSGPQTPSTIMSSATGVTDVALVGWRLSADATQAAGAYTGTTDYITTGTF